MTEIERLERLYTLKRELKIINARESFWDFQKITDPHSFRDDRTYLIVLALSLQSFYKDEPASYLADYPLSHHTKLDMVDCTIDYSFEAEGDKTRITVDISGADTLIIEAPRRHHKSHSLINFECWVFGQDPKHIMITSAHNTDLANEFSQYVRDGIKEQRVSPTAIIYSDIFPLTIMKYGDSSKKRWALSESFLSYAGSGILTPVTGKGGRMIVFDDPIKGPLEAFNEVHLDKLWSAYVNGWLAPLEHPRKQILVMTPWVLGDIGDRIVEGAEESGEIVKIYNCKAYTPTQGMLCTDILDKRAFDILCSRLDPVILSGNYLCTRIGSAGALYPELKYYTPDEKPKKFDEIYCYIDTADQGDDYLAAPVVGLIHGKDEFDLPIKKAYLLDIYYTQDGMHITEDETARFLMRNHIQSTMNVDIESNNGGSGFGRNVIRILKTMTGWRGIIINTFHQSENKMARINSESNTIMKYFYFPKNCEQINKSWFDAMTSMKKYSKEGKNKNDDVQDSLTGIAEKKVNTEFTMFDAIAASKRG